jgi:hypothetical protein
LESLRHGLASASAEAHMAAESAAVTAGTFYLSYTSSAPQELVVRGV